MEWDGDVGGEIVNLVVRLCEMWSEMWSEMSWDVKWSDGWGGPLVVGACSFCRGLVTPPPITSSVWRELQTQQLQKLRADHIPLQVSHCSWHDPTFYPRHFCVMTCMSCHGLRMIYHFCAWGAELDFSEDTGELIIWIDERQRNDLKSIKMENCKD